jgi:hypothetical protein
MSSLDGDLVISFEVLKLVLFDPFFIFHNFCLIGQSVSKFWPYLSGFWLLKNFVEIRFLFSLTFIYRKVHCRLFCARLRYLSLLKVISKSFIGGHFAYFQPIWSILINLSRCSFEHDLIFREILLNGAAQFLHSLSFFIALINYHSQDDC